MNYEIFREELAIKYPDYGHALWEPSPVIDYSVEIGDVGFIREGEFNRLFNILPASNESHRYHVPQHHELPIKMGILPANNLRSHEISDVSDEHRRRAAGPDEAAQFSFSCSKKRGAILALPVPAKRKDTAAKGIFAQWILKYIDEWFAFARERGLGICREDIILVTGRHLAKSWATMAFQESQRDEYLSFGFQVSGNSNVEWQFTPEGARGVACNLGPSGQNLPENQCIFVRGFRVARFSKIFPRLRGAAGPAQLPDEDDPHPDAQLISTPADTLDPLHTLLEYISTRAPDCDVALVHDDDLRYVDTTSLESLRADTLMSYLQKSAPEIHQVEFECTKVATLSNSIAPELESTIGKNDRSIVEDSKRITLNPSPSSRQDFTPKAGVVNPTGPQDTPKKSLPIVRKQRPRSIHSVSLVTGRKPDKAAHDAEQGRINAEIDVLQKKLTSMREKISLATKGGSGNEKRNALRAQLEKLRSQQSGNKTPRNKIFEQIKTRQEGIQKRIKDLQASRSKTEFGTVEDVDAHIRKLEKQVDSGSLKIAEEKRALQEISHTKRIRKTVEGFQTKSDAIDAERTVVEELKKQLDDPEAKAITERYDAIKAELDEIKKEEDELYANRSQLFEERNSMQQQLDALFSERHELNARFREANGRFYTKLNEDRSRRAEQQRKQKEAEYEERRKARVLGLREEASQPVFQVQIEDCQTLIDYFSSKSTTAVVSSAKVGYAEPKLDIRQVEAAPGSLVARKKKGEEEEAYFVGGKGKNRGKKGPKASGTDIAEAATSSSNVNVPFGTLSALLSLSIPPPFSQADVPRVVEDLKTKKAWFEANQARTTAEAIAKAEAEIQHLLKGKGESASASPLDDLTNKDSVEMPEPAPILKTVDEPSSDVEAGKPEALQEAEAS